MPDEYLPMTSTESGVGTETRDGVTSWSLLGDNTR